MSTLANNPGRDPPTIAYAGTDFVTTAPAATTAPSPILLCGRITERLDIQARSPISTGPPELFDPNIASLMSCCSVHIHAPVEKLTFFPILRPFLPSNLHSSPIIVPSPISIFHGNRISNPPYGQHGDNGRRHRTHENQI